MIGIVAAEFPDIDHPKSLPRKVLRKIMPVFILSAFAILFFVWRIWEKDPVSFVLFIAAPAFLIIFYEKFIPRHRGATHKWPGLTAMVLISLPLGLAIGGFVNVLIIVSFVVIGFSTHILLDHL